MASMSRWMRSCTARIGVICALLSPCAKGWRQPRADASAVQRMPCARGRMTIGRTQDRTQRRESTDSSSGPADASFLVPRVPSRLLLALVQLFLVGVADVAEPRSPRAVLAPVHAAPHVQLLPPPSLPRTGG